MFGYIVIVILKKNKTICNLEQDKYLSTLLIYHLPFLVPTRTRRIMDLWDRGFCYTKVLPRKFLGKITRSVERLTSTNDNYYVKC